MDRTAGIEGIAAVHLLPRVPALQGSGKWLRRTGWVEARACQPVPATKLARSTCGRRLLLTAHAVPSAQLPLLITVGHRSRRSGWPLALVALALSMRQPARAR